MAWRTVSNRLYLNEEGDGQGLIGVEGGMGFGMSLKSLTLDSLMSRMRSSHYHDETDLIFAAQREYAARQENRNYSTRVPGAINDLEELDKQLQEMSGEDEDFQARLFRLIEKYEIRLPSIRVDYSDLNISTQALVGDEGFASVGNSFKNLFKGLLCMKPHTVEHKILKNIKGVLMPGRLTLLLGPPGCGKTSFLKVLSGRYQKSPTLNISGNITYNGHTFDQFEPRRTSAFVSQHDVHVAVLTVAETLQFAYVCQQGYKHKDFDLAGELEAVIAKQADGGDADDKEFIKMLKDVKRSGTRVATTMRMFGIGHTKNTPVGDSMLRGVSGGERKRVSTVEMLVGPRRIMFLDEISTGLDSATLYNIISLLAKNCRGHKYNMLVSLLQPPPEVFELFDDVCLMSDGYVVYHGPVGEVKEFFESMGFECPRRKDLPSFLQEVTTASGQHEYATPELLKTRDVAPGATGDAARKYIIPMEEVVEEFWKCPAGVKMAKLMDKKFDPQMSHPAALVKGHFAMSPMESLMTVTKRFLLLVSRDPVLIRGRLIQVCIMGLIVGSLFYQMEPTPQQARSFFGVGFLAVMFTAMGTLPQLAITMFQKPVWFKFRDNLFYPSWVQAISTALCGIPVQIIDNVLWTIIIYFMAGFTLDVGRFFIFLLNLFSIGTAIGAMMRLIAHIAPDGVSANAYGSISILILTIMSGFAIVRPNIPDYYIWAYYMSPFAWGLRTLVINEMTAPRWDYPYCVDQVLPDGAIAQVCYPSCGIAMLEGFGFFTTYAWVWGGIGFQFGFAIICTMFSCVALQIFSGEKKIARVADEEALEAARQKREQLKAQTNKEKDVERMETFQNSMRSGGATSMNRSGTSKTPRQMSSLKLSPTMGVDGKPKAPIETQTKIPFEPITLVFKNLRYFVPNPSYGQKPAKPKATEKANPLAQPLPAAAVPPAAPQPAEIPKKLELLKGITGYAEPGQLTALMGGSGAGKTTLMDCIAGRKTVGEITGDIMVNGHPKNQATWSRVMGYCEQMDIHTPATTVIEALMFSARLRLPSELSNDAVAAYVEEVMEIIDLGDIRYDLVGLPGVTGLSTEQRKRLTIAVELVANPAVVFMDEPTSGLDARAAAIVMRAVRNVALNNRAVLVTIHQPSIEIFESFDFLLLLQRGGRTTYFGPLGEESCNLVNYLEAVPGCAKIEPGVNPATWMLEVTGGSTSVKAKAVKADWPELYKNSQLAENNAIIADELHERDAKEKQPLAVAGGKYAANFSQQLVVLFKKFERVYWRTPSYNFTRFLVTALCACLYGSVYYKAADLSPVVILADVQSITGVIYSSTSFIGMTNMLAIMPLMGLERVVYYREQAASMYNPWAYSLTTSVIEIPYLLVQVSIFVCIMYPMIKYINTAASFFYYYLLTFQSILFFISFGMCLVYITPSQQLASVFAAGLNFLFNIFNGFVIPAPVIPKYWAWANKASPTTWLLYGLAADQLGNNQIRASYPIDTSVKTVSQMMDVVFGYQYDFRMWCILIVFAYICFLRFVGVMALRYVSFLKR